MKKIYLIRHGKTDNAHRCIGRTDISLAQDAFQEMERVRPFLPQYPMTVYTSPLKRARETAQYLYPEQCIREIEDLKETDCGFWENLSFEKIRADWKQEYEKRGADPYRARIPGGESYEETGKRVLNAIRRLERECDTDLVIITHAGCIKSLACCLGAMKKEDLLDRKIKHLSQTILEVQKDMDGPVSLKCPGAYPDELMTEADIKKIYEICAPSQNVIGHMEAVAAYADELAEMLNMRQINRGLLHNACLLHDAARGEKNHAVAGAGYLRSMGFYKIASIIEKHHDLGLDNPNEIGQIDEALLLFYADKRVQGTKRVSLEERFEKSREKCQSKEALDMNARRYQAANCAEKLIAAYMRGK